MFRSTIAAFLFLLFALPSFSQQYSILDFGARPNSGNMNTAAIQSAIDKCTASGGGEVVFPAGVFYTGTILLKPNVYLHLMPGTVLQGSYNPADYPEHNIEAAKKYGTIVHDGLYVKWLKALVIADNISNTGIFGEGTVKGAGEGTAFQLGENKNGKPMNLLFIGCTNIFLKGIQVLNSAQVTISISGCEKVLVDAISVKSLVNWNTDGMDVDGRNITISNCVIDSEDDALCFKSEYLGKFCENVTATNCVLSSNCNGLKWGTGSRTGFRNFTVSNIVIKKPSQDILRKWNIRPGIIIDDKTTSVNTGIVILGVDGGLVENISISNVVMTDVITPITIRVGKRFLNAAGKPSLMRHIRIQNVIAESQSIIPSIIAGVPDSPVEDVKLTNIRILIPIGVSADSFKTFPTIVPEAEKSYPENRMFGLKLPGSALYARHVKGLYLHEVAVYYQAADVRPAFYLDDVAGATFRAVLIDDKKLSANAVTLFRKDSSVVEVAD